MNIFQQLNKEALLKLTLDDVPLLLGPEDVVHIARELGAFWTYDYQALEQGRPGLHALLKSQRHSDGFFVSRILLEPPNIRLIMAAQLAMRLRQAEIQQPDFIAGIPDGATMLGEAVAQLMNIPIAKLVKTDGRIKLESEIPENSTLLLIEDFCTRGTGFTEAVQEIHGKQPSVKFVMHDPVIINRGGLSEVVVESVGAFKTLAVVEKRINDWEASECPLCARGSVVIKPKLTDENWQRITTSQLAQT